MIADAAYDAATDDDDPDADQKRTELETLHALCRTARPKHQRALTLNALDLTIVRIALHELDQLCTHLSLKVNASEHKHYPAEYLEDDFRKDVDRLQTRIAEHAKSCQRTA